MRDLDQMSEFEMMMFNKIDETARNGEITFEMGDPDALAFIDTKEVVAHLEGLGYLVKDLSEWTRPDDVIPGRKDIGEIIARLDIVDDGAKPYVDLICWRYKE